MIFILKGNWWILLTIIISLFVGIYIYAASSTFIENLKAKKARKKKLIKEEELRLRRVKNDEIRATKIKLVEKRSEEIKKEFTWLEEINKKIKNKADNSQEKISQ